MSRFRLTPFVVVVGTLAIGYACMFAQVVLLAWADLVSRMVR